MGVISKGLIFRGDSCRGLVLYEKVEDVQVLDVLLQGLMLLGEIII